MTQMPVLDDGSFRLLLQLANQKGVTPESELTSIVEAEAYRIGLQKGIASRHETYAAYDAMFEIWATIIELRDQESRGHSQRVTRLSLQFAHHLGLPQESFPHIRRGALLHDVGKMAIPDSILLKKGALTEEERRIVQRHPAHARTMLETLPFLRDSLDIPYCHHEQWDGKGYPRGLKGRAIPLHARLFTIVDVWDALVSPRPYRRPREVGQAREYLQSQASLLFDPDLLMQFLKMDLSGEVLPFAGRVEN